MADVQTEDWRGKLSHGLSAKPSDLGKRQSVIIEVDLAPDTVVVRAVRHDPGRRTLAFGGAPADPVEQARRLEAVAALVLEATHRRPVIIGGAGAVVADLTPGQLERIARSPLVRQIQPNRTHTR